MKRIASFLLAALILSGCVRSIPGAASSEITSTATKSTQPGLPAEISSDSPTSGVDSTPTPALPLPTGGPTPAWKGTTDPRFTETSVVEVGFIDVGILIVVLDTKTAVAGDYQAVVGPDVYPCTRLEKYPTRLYCSGPAPDPNTTVKLTLYPASGGEALFQVDVKVPDQMRNVD